MNQSRRKRCFILTVGTSLITNYRQGVDTRTIRLFFGHGRPVTATRKKIECAIQKSSIENWLKGKTGNDLLQASAELKSLLNIRPRPCKGDVAVLIATRTAAGLVCAHLLEKILVASQELQVACFYPDGLGAPDDKRFVTAGLPALLSVISREIGKADQAGYQVILIPTGGYKSLIPYATLAGILHGKEIRYIYETSKTLISLPALPVGLDTARWKPAYLKLQILTSQPQRETTAYYRDLDPAFHNLLKPPATGSKPYGYTHLGEYLVARYRARQHHGPLQLQTDGTSLLKYLARGNGEPDLAAHFSRLTGVGPHFWFGDKVPEMVEHSAHHHTNLFELAEILLLPILEEGNGFLSPEELFILLGVIFFHDWGHSLGRLGKTVLLPTEIRQWHHVLSYQRMASRPWRGKLIAAGIDWAGGSEQDLWREYLAAIATVGVYHRQKMPLRTGHFDCWPYIGKKFGPLAEKKRIHFEDKPVPGRRAAFLAALFRVIDSLDNQVARMGTPEEMAMKAAVVAGDAREARRRERDTREILRDYLGGSQSALYKEIDRQAKAIAGGYRRAESATGNRAGAGAAPARSPRDTCRDLADQVQGTNAEKAMFARLVASCLEAAAWAAFREDQPAHYLKHLAIRAPVIAYLGKNSTDTHRVRLSFQPEDPEKVKGYAAMFGVKGSAIPAFHDIVAGIRAEYTEEVKAVLEDNRLEIEYQ